MQFVAIDVETANPNLASICQIGVARFVDGAIADERSWLVDPEDYFDIMNVMVHGIDASAVDGQPTLPSIAPDLLSFIQDTVCVSHTHFDRAAVTRAFSRYSIAAPTFTWLDSARVARRTWSQFAQKGYGLANLCEHLGLRFRHHDALEDAKASGNILLAAIRETGLSLDDWLRRAHQPIDPSRTTVVALDGNPEGDLYGEVVVFTGSLQIPRREAAQIAARAGCAVDLSVTKRTTMLVVGDQDLRRLAGADKSSKHRKAEKLIADGQPIRILTESDFQTVADLAAS